MTVMMLERPARAAAADTIPSPCAIVELRRYALHPGRRETLIELFDREFVHTQEDCGMRVLGQFRDLDAPDDFVSLRGFANMAERREALAAFYGGPVWQRHRNAANATMQDSSNVLLLRNVQTAATHAARPGMLLAVVCALDAPVTPQLVQRFEHEVRPCRRARIIAEHVPDLVDADVLQSELREDALQLLAAHFFLELRRGNLAEADLVGNRLRLVRFDRVNRRLDRGILDEIGRRRRTALRIDHTQRQRRRQSARQHGSKHVNLR
jgi:hypothetical protein